ncbi:MAG: 1-acyl-sn-glycerol-3-phosphate acyltransferase [Bifidobacteriaceae bacterium]|jgi:1-acyl-sn-glycerol-3-phosphate acyltransferase|nr:1-acyl-sn-glycerol-3-phosphate acyltransferase [Bifidobacteriaceae bacterium]
MTEPRKQGLPRAFQAGMARRVAWILNCLWLATKVTGLEHVPRKGPAILAGNHTGLVDGPVILGAAPRGVHFIMKWSLGQGFGGLLLKASGQVPLAKDNGHAALRTCLGLLERGALVGIFPEGSRGDGKMSQIHPGVAWLAVNSGAPVIPFACLGTRRQGESATHLTPFRRRVLVSFGPPVALELDADASRRERTGAALEQIGRALAEHVEAAVAASGIALPTDTGRKSE